MADEALLYGFFDVRQLPLEELEFHFRFSLSFFCALNCHSERQNLQMLITRILNWRLLSNQYSISAFCRKSISVSVRLDLIFYLLGGYGNCVCFPDSVNACPAFARTAFLLYWVEPDRVALSDSYVMLVTSLCSNNDIVSADGLCAFSPHTF